MTLLIAQFQEEFHIGSSFPAVCRSERLAHELLDIFVDGALFKPDKLGLVLEIDIGQSA
jgi:hypothetical protein